LGVHVTIVRLPPLVKTADKPSRNSPSPSPTVSLGEAQSASLIDAGATVEAADEAPASPGLNSY